jgi:hypothetical protein
VISFFHYKIYLISRQFLIPICSEKAAQLLSASAVDPHILACYDIENWTRAPRKLIEGWIDTDVKDGKINMQQLLGVPDDNQAVPVHSDGSKVPSSLPKLKLNIIDKSSSKSTDEIVSKKRKLVNEIPKLDKVEEVFHGTEKKATKRSKESIVNSRRCLHEGCTKCAQGKTSFCIAHGGGRRCTFPGCSKVNFNISK